jgi:hypothetical protein
VQTTTTDLAADLRQRLETAGLTRADAQQIVDLLPPAGQHQLAVDLRDNPNAVHELRATYRDVLAVQLRTTVADADLIAALLWTVP